MRISGISVQYQSFLKLATKNLRIKSREETPIPKKTCSQTLVWSKHQFAPREHVDKVDPGVAWKVGGRAEVQGTLGAG